MVGLSRVIGQDVNIFSGARLQATSERDLFASGLLPTRTPADVYRAIVLDRMPTRHHRGAGGRLPLHGRRGAAARGATATRSSPSR